MATGDDHAIYLVSKLSGESGEDSCGSIACRGRHFYLLDDRVEP